MKNSDLGKDIAYQNNDMGSSLSSSSGKTSRAAVRGSDLPDRYGDNKIMLLVRDPEVIYSYWEIKRDVEDKVKNEIHAKGLAIARSILRVYELTGVSPKVLYDIELKNWADSWYIHVGNPGKEWMVDIGFLCTNGEFFTLARSNVVKTPLNRMSDISDEEWMCPEELYFKMFAVTGGFDIGKSSLELRELMERHLLIRKEHFSGGMLMGGISSAEFGSSSLFRGVK
ncbi:MAG: DUF4912 domain-containing protein [Candidatus Omnitrophota bacterium]